MTMPVAVNVSVHQLILGSEELFWAPLRVHDIPASMIELEVSEPAFMENYERNVSILKRLRQLGFGVAIDNLGTGSLSLYHLHRLPVSTLKIDGSLIRNITHSDDT